MSGCSTTSWLREPVRTIRRRAIIDFVNTLMKKICIEASSYTRGHGATARQHTVEGPDCTVSALVGGQVCPVAVCPQRNRCLPFALTFPADFEEIACALTRRNVMRQIVTMRRIGIPSGLPGVAQWCRTPLGVLVELG